MFVNAFLAVSILRLQLSITSTPNKICQKKVRFFPERDTRIFFNVLL